MFTDSKAVFTEPLGVDLPFLERFSEVRALQEQLCEDRVFLLHANSLAVKQHRRKIAADKFPALEEKLGYFFLVFCLLVITVCCYPVMRRTWWTASLAISVLAVGISALCMWYQDYSKVYFASCFGRWPFFDVELLSPSDRELARKLCSFLDQAENSKEAVTPLRLPPNQGRSTIGAAHESLYGLCLPGVFRLLILEAGRFDAPILCRLVRHQLGYHKYAALSYAWGNMEDPVQIAVNGQPFKIGRNLETALRYLRHEKEPMVLWIDAICINQCDDVEKSQQVAAMSDVYHHAERVVIFLGAGYDCKELFDFCDQLTTLRSSEDAIDDYFENQLDLESVILQLLLLLKQAWWQRSWIVQEVAYARHEPYIMYGHRRASSNSFNEVFEQFYERHRAMHQVESGGDGSVPADYDDDWEKLNRTRSVLRWRRRLHPVHYSVANLLQFTRSQQATEPRDKIFAFSSLMTEPIRTTFTPDYAKSETSVYTRMGAYLLCIEKWSKMYQVFPLAADRPPGTPSWVPDFSAKNSQVDEALLWTHFPPLNTGELRAVVNMGVLGIRGFYCGKVNCVGASIIDETDEASRLFQEFRDAILHPVAKPPDAFQAAILGLYKAMNVAGAPFFTPSDLEKCMEMIHGGYPIRMPEKRSLEYIHALSREARKTRRGRISQRFYWGSTRGLLWVRRGRGPKDHLTTVAKELQEDHKEDQRRAANELQRQVQFLFSPGETQAMVDQVVSQSVVFTTDTGFAGVAPVGTLDSDCLVVFTGIDLGFIARRRHDDREMELVGKVLHLNADTVKSIRNGVKEGVLEENTMYLR